MCWFIQNLSNISWPRPAFLYTPSQCTAANILSSTDSIFSFFPPFSVWVPLCSGCFASGEILARVMQARTWSLKVSVLQADTRLAFGGLTCAESDIPVFFAGSGSWGANCSFLLSLVSGDCSTLCDAQGDTAGMATQVCRRGDGQKACKSAWIVFPGLLLTCWELLGSACSPALIAALIL